MQLNAVFAKQPDCLLEDMDGELLLYSPSSATTLHLNGSSAIIWDLIDGKNSVEDVIAELKAAFPDHAEQITQDVIDAFSEFENRNVIVSVNLS